MKKLYLSAWVLLGTAVFFSLVSGTFDAGSLLIASLTGLGLFYAFALWSVIFNAPDARVE